MAGDWLKIEISLPDKPEVWQIAGMLGIDPDAVVGKLIKVWRWFDTHTTDGNACGVTYALVDSVAGVTGFAEAMSFSGWLLQNDRTLSLPNFDRHNGKSSKKRALTAVRVANHKQESNAKGNAPCVSDALPREEKRREELFSGSADADPPKSDPIPYQAIVDGYNSTLTRLAKVRMLTTDRKTAIRKAWQSVPDRSLRFFDAIWRTYADDPFTNGTGPYAGDHANWRPDFDYLIRGKVITRAFERAMTQLETMQ